MRRVGWIACFMLIWAAPASAAPQLDRVVIGTGGGTATSGTLRLDLTIGEPVIGPAMNGTVLAKLGFWCTVHPATVDVPSKPESPTAFGVNQSPNPFTTRTSIVYTIPKGDDVTVSLGIYDLNGRLVATLASGRIAPGRHTATWDGRGDSGELNPAGVYFVTFKAGTFHATRKVVMVK